jgi:hypothetical protein
MDSVRAENVHTASLSTDATGQADGKRDGLLSKDNPDIFPTCGTAFGVA